jgi:hypothetical protein
LPELPLRENLLQKSSLPTYHSLPLNRSRVLRLQHQLAATPCYFARLSHSLRAVFPCFDFLLLYCPAAFDNRGTLPSTVRFKTTRGETASMGSVICRAMENSLCESLRMQLSEARGIGGLIWRIGVTQFQTPIRTQIRQT